MGLFDGLTGGSDSAEFDKFTPFDVLPGFLKERGQNIGNQSFKLFEDLIRRGESAAGEELFSRSRTRSLKDFERATESAGLNFNRLGLGSSGESNRTFASLALSLGDVLAAQDAQRAEKARGVQLQGAQSGLNAVNSIASGTALVPKQKSQGLFDGLGTSLIGQGIGTFFGGPIGAAIGGSLGGKLGG